MCIKSRAPEGDVLERRSPPSPRGGCLGEEKPPKPPRGMSRRGEAPQAPEGDVSERRSPPSPRGGCLGEESGERTPVAWSFCVEKTAVYACSTYSRVTRFSDACDTYSRITRFSGTISLPPLFVILYRF